MSELRKDPVVGRWVIISAERGKRPMDYLPDKKITTKKEACPFCPGNEDKTPGEIISVRDQITMPNSPGWEIRVFPNKYPALRVEGELGKTGLGIYDMMNGLGAHEIIIDTPDHDADIHEIPIESLIKVFDTYKERLLDLQKDTRFRYIMIFRNRGRSAGASISHSHTQLIATPITPKRIKEILQGSQDYYNYKDRCVFCDIITEELRQNTRIVHENEHFISFCPFASCFPFEIHVMPKRHDPDYHSITTAELVSLAGMIRFTLGKLSKALDKPDYNYVVITGPVKWPRRGYWTTIQHDFHWHIEIIPRITNIAGFEWGTGFFINTTPPEEAAKYLREC